MTDWLETTTKVRIVCLLVVLVIVIVLKVTI